MALILRGGGVAALGASKLHTSRSRTVSAFKSGAFMSMKIETSRVVRGSLGKGAVILTMALAWVPSANAATANISASVTIVPPAAMTEASDLRFAGFVAGATPGTLTLRVTPALPEVSPTSAAALTGNKRQASGGVRLVGGSRCTAGLDCGLGAVQIGGPVSGAFNSVSTQPSTTLTAGESTMTLEGIELRYGAGGTAGTVSGSGTLSQSGTGTIVIGGVLAVGARQAAGTYTGSLMVSMDY
jgi:hypothetical protein